MVDQSPAAYDGGARGVRHGDPAGADPARAKRGARVTPGQRAAPGARAARRPRQGALAHSERAARVAAEDRSRHGGGAQLGSAHRRDRGRRVEPAAGVSSARVETVKGGAMDRREYTVKEFAVIERVTERTVRRWVAKAAIVVRRTAGGRIRVLDGAARACHIMTIRDLCGHSDR